MYYVYTHTDPRSHELVYIGKGCGNRFKDLNRKGCGGRAWDVTRNRGGHLEHQIWMQNLMIEGYIPSDWVTVIYRNLSELEAFSKEKLTLHTNGTTRFNRQSGERNYQAKLSDEQAREIYVRAKTENHSALAVEFKVSRAAISMINTRKQWKAATANI